MQKLPPIGKRKPVGFMKSFNLGRYESNTDPLGVLKKAVMFTKSSGLQLEKKKPNSLFQKVTRDE